MDLWPAQLNWSWATDIQIRLAAKILGGNTALLKHGRHEIVPILEDTGWFGTNGYDARKALEELYTRIKHIHLRRIRRSISGVRLSRYYLQGMLARNSGRIVFISSESAISPVPEMAHYSATKLMQLSRS